MDRAAGDAGGAAILDAQAIDAKLGEATGAGGESARQVAHERGLLGARGATEDAVVGAGAGFLVAAVHLVAPAELLGSLDHELVVFADRHVGLVARVDARFDPFEKGFERLGSEVGRARSFFPLRQDRLGRAVSHAAVHDRAAADAATLEVRDVRLAEDQRRASVAVKARDGIRRVRTEARRRMVAALLDEQNIEPRLGKLGPRDGATCAGAYDDDVGVELPFARVVGVAKNRTRRDVRHHDLRSRDAIRSTASGAFTLSAMSKCFRKSIRLAMKAAGA